MKSEPSKTEVRELVRAARADLPPRDERAAALAAAGMALLAGRVRAGEAVAGFADFGSEPPTERLIAALQAAGLRVLLPRVAADLAEPSLTWHEVTGDWTVDAYGIRTPDSPAEPAGLSGCRAVFVPAVAASRDGRRLGRGRGYYDRALAALPRFDAGGPLRIAVVAPAGLLADGVIPMAPHDQWLDEVLVG